MFLFLPENLRTNNIAFSLVMISLLIIQIPLFLSSYIIFSFVETYYNPKQSHLTSISIMITICPLIFPLIIPSFMLLDGFRAIKPEEVILYFIIAGFLYSLPFCLYYYFQEINKKKKEIFK